jgi:hypothetical protein
MNIPDPNIEGWERRNAAAPAVLVTDVHEQPGL